MECACRWAIPSRWAAAGLRMPRSRRTWARRAAGPSGGGGGAWSASSLRDWSAAPRSRSSRSRRAPRTPGSERAWRRNALSLSRTHCRSLTNTSERGKVNASPFSCRSTLSSDFSSRWFWGEALKKKVIRKRGIVGNVVAAWWGEGVEISCFGGDAGQFDFL